jgi:drug/metabolite transporter (DMT)-like permease
MKKWLRRIRGAVLMGLTWAVVWAPVGVLIGFIVDPTGAMDEPWILVGAYPGFLGGVLFSTVFAIAARRRRLDELSLRRVGAWGALAGVVLGLIPFALGTPNPSIPVWQLASIFVGGTTLLCTTSAVASLALAKRAEERESLGAGADVADVGLTEDEKKELLGGRR